MNKKKKPVNKETVRLCTLVWNYLVLIQVVPMRAVDVVQAEEEKLRKINSTKSCDFLKKLWSDFYKVGD